MTLQEKAQYMQNTLAEIHRDVAAALTIQGLYREPEDFYLQEIGDLIRLIKTEDFQFRYDFKALDSVGRIHARKEGQAAGGSGINPIMVADVPWWFVIDFSGLTTQVREPIHGAFGMPCGGVFTFGSMEDIQLYTFDFKALDSLPDALVPMPEEVATM